MNDIIFSGEKLFSVPNSNSHSAINRVDRTRNNIEMSMERIKETELSYGN